MVLTFHEEDEVNFVSSKSYQSICLIMVTPATVSKYGILRKMCESCLSLLFWKLQTILFQAFNVQVETSDVKSCYNELSIKIETVLFNY